MPTTHKFVSLIMCDDCRREDNGKEILIGTYSGSMVASTVPFVLPTFALRFEIIAGQTEYKKAITLMKNPKGEEVFRVDGTIAISRPDLPASFFFKVSPVMITMTGEYTIFLGLDEEPEKVATLEVIQGEVPSLQAPLS